MTKIQQVLAMFSHPDYKTRYRTAKSRQTCIICNNPASVFRDEGAKLQYEISALCQSCQDNILRGDRPRRFFSAIEMKYTIVRQEGTIVIKVSGKTRDNEPLVARRILTRYLREQGIRVIIDLTGIEDSKTIALVGVLHGIRKEVGLLKGDMKLCSLRPTLLTNFKEHGLDRMFTICNDEQTARKSTWKTHDER
jgi:anti-anti-sigma factor